MITEGDVGAESKQSAQEISEAKIASLAESFEKARASIRELLGIQEGEPDTFFLGVFGSTVKGTARQNSDVDAYLFFTRVSSTPSSNWYLDYDLAQTFDSPAKSLFGHPADRKAPNPDGKEDVEAHDITTLINDIATNQQLSTGLISNKITEIAIIFSPQVIGNVDYINTMRHSILEAMNIRTGQPFDRRKFLLMWDQGLRFPDDVTREYNPPYEEDAFDGVITWKLVQAEYLRLFGKSLDVDLSTI